MSVPAHDPRSECESTEREVPLASTLDPDDWSEAEALLIDAAQRITRRLSSIRDEPAWTEPSERSRALAYEPLPRAGTPLSDVYEQALACIWPHPTGNIHPRFWGWVHGTGTHAGILADLLMSGMNAHVSGFNQGATYVERAVVSWLRQTMGFPDSASGVLVSGGTVANLIGLLIARNTHFPGVREGGMRAIGSADPVVFASELVHGWAAKSCDILGLGTQALRLLPVDDRGRIRLDALADGIESERSAGRSPFAIIGSAGTVSTGSVDDLNALADIAAEQDLWFHIDGAFGAMAKLSTPDAHRVSGLDRANSLAFDLHKWGYMQFDVGCTLVRDRSIHLRAMSFTGTYLESIEAGIGKDPTEFASVGLQLSRSFRALRVWMCLKAHGIESIGRAIAANCAQARLLASLIDSDPELELMAPVTLNVVCFRYNPADLDETSLDALNREIMIRLQVSGFAVLSSTRLDGRFVLRAAITNHRTQESDIRQLVCEVKRIGQGIVE